MKPRANSYAFCGGAFGDEGKGRIVDEYVAALAKKGRVVVYRDNGGANAGHTVTLPGGQKIALHQLPSGVFCDQATVILGKGMVIHPGDLLIELDQVQQLKQTYPLATIVIDEMAVLSLDTHRAYESALKRWEEGGKGSTGRGISPAYADVLLRHPIRVRDITDFNQAKLEKHYALYTALTKGLGESLVTSQVASLEANTVVAVGDLKAFLARLHHQATALKKYVADVNTLVTKTWADDRVGYVFEKAQAVGLDYRWGVYPDVTASDTTFAGIEASSEGIINPETIKLRAAVIKATYMSSVGIRVLPTKMEKELTDRIREDAHEYGATTRRPRGIAYLDLPALRFYTKVGLINAHVLTHMDISYDDVPIKVCVSYQLAGKKVAYRPDQEFLLKVKPIYKEFPSWNSQQIRQAKRPDQIPVAAKKFIAFIEKELGTKVMMITTGPQRHQGIKM